MSPFRVRLIGLDPISWRLLTGWGSVLAVLLIVLLLGMLFYRRYVGISSGKACALVLLAILLAWFNPAGVAWAATRIGHAGWVPFVPWTPSAVFAGLTPDMSSYGLRLGLMFFLVPFCAKLHSKWVYDAVTVAERKPGMEGVRAWLGGGNLVVALVLAVMSAANGFSFLTTLLAAGLALAAYPLLTTIIETPGIAESPRDDLSGEREKVLKLLEEGKITADEAGELLSALGQTVHRRRNGLGPVAPSRRAVFLGTILLVIGFLLPWRLSLPPAGAPYAAWPIQLGIAWNGGGLPGGLGWLVLILGVTAAVLPFLAREWDRYTQRNWMLASLGVGAVILLVTALESGPYIGFGLILMMAGYALEFFGVIRERPA